MGRHSAARRRVHARTVTVLAVLPLMVTTSGVQLSPASSGTPLSPSSATAPSASAASASAVSASAAWSAERLSRATAASFGGADTGRTPGVPVRPLAATSRAPERAGLGRARSSDIPWIALQAYQRSAVILGQVDPRCGVTWTLLAAIGQVESEHGQVGESRLAEDGVARPGIVGIRLDGKGSRAMVEDTDDGALDGDRRWDRAVGPMQLLPGTWQVAGVDGDGDGHRSEQDVDDAALAAGVVLCAAGSRLGDRPRAEAALLSYNSSRVYVDQVIAVEAAYRDGHFSVAGLPEPQAIGALLDPGTGTRAQQESERALRVATGKQGPEVALAARRSQGPGTVRAAEPRDGVAALRTGLAELRTKLVQLRTDMAEPRAGASQPLSAEGEGTAAPFDLTAWYSIRAFLQSDGSVEDEAATMADDPAEVPVDVVEAAGNAAQLDGTRSYPINEPRIEATDSAEGLSQSDGVTSAAEPTGDAGDSDQSQSGQDGSVLSAAEPTTGASTFTQDESAEAGTPLGTIDAKSEDGPAEPKATPESGEAPAPADRARPEQADAERTPTEQERAGQVPAEQAPVEQETTPQAPAEQATPQETPVEKPATDPSAPSPQEDGPTAEAAGDNAPAQEADDPTDQAADDPSAEQPADQDADESAAGTPGATQLATEVTGVWSACGDGYCVDGSRLDLTVAGEPASPAAADFDGDGIVETLPEEFAGLEGRAVELTVVEGGDPLVVVAVNGVPTRPGGDRSAT